MDKIKLLLYMICFCISCKEGISVKPTEIHDTIYIHDAIEGINLNDSIIYKRLPLWYITYEEDKKGNIMYQQYYINNIQVDSAYFYKAVKNVTK